MAPRTFWSTCSSREPESHRGQISAAIESVGGELNAYTAKEHTCFYARVLHSDAELALDVLTDMITPR